MLQGLGDSDGASTDEGRGPIRAMARQPGAPSELSEPTGVLANSVKTMLRQTHPSTPAPTRVRARSRKPAVAKLKMFRRPPPDRPAPRKTVNPLLPQALRAVIFDVEGTLVDTVLPTLRCWQETLAEFGLSFTTAELHQYSGLGSDEMLDHLLPAPATKLEKARVLRSQAYRYRANCLPNVVAFPGGRELLEALRAGGIRVVVATSCAKDELAHYLEVARCADLIDASACGDEVRRHKPHPDLLLKAIERIRLPGNRDVAAVGDTPFDAYAALAAGVEPIGVLTGHFSRNDLVDAGCNAVCRDLIDLCRLFTDDHAAGELAQAGIAGLAHH
jgi:phosphoglycolate phosphatase-like HAD superfamily hydrolase